MEKSIWRRLGMGEHASRNASEPGGENITGGAALKGVGAGPYERGSGVMPAEQRGLTETCICGAAHNVREIRTSGLMSGVGKRDGHCSQHQRPSSTLPGGGFCRRAEEHRRRKPAA